MPDADSARGAREKWLADLASRAELEALPVYMAGRVPEGLATRRQLRAAGLSAAGLKPAARLHYCAYHYLCPLYERSAARPVRPLTGRQRENLAAGRALAGTSLCSKCRQARTAKWSGDRWCRSCRKQDDDRRWAAEAAARNREVEEVTTWAREVLADPTAVVLDTETTGLGNAFIVEIAVLAVDGTVLLDTRVNPGVPIPQDATWIHGITDADVKDAPSFAGLWTELKTLLEGRRIVIYNAFTSQADCRERVCRKRIPPDLRGPGRMIRPGPLRSVPGSIMLRSPAKATVLQARGHSVCGLRLSVAAPTLVVAAVAGQPALSPLAVPRRHRTFSTGQRLSLTPPPLSSSTGMHCQAGGTWAACREVGQ